jgi:hypothetical protein
MNTWRFLLRNNCVEVFSNNIILLIPVMKVAGIFSLELYSFSPSCVFSTNPFQCESIANAITIYSGEPTKEIVLRTHSQHI